ncbi:cytochrome c [Sphingomonas sp. KRR8]|uniref:c-type cytochrome n=1 Tax=Sphingomonas sp. KRR8 TaxID=2942996 RepID=UPI0020228074|nr:cytochrome c [Sphingomonas sp. KRR8]URD61007.1 cytochrome c [Sphingomonas sp. KRR8]
MKILLGLTALATVAAAAPLTKDRALGIMHQRHETMEQIGRSMRAAKQGIEANNVAQVRTAAATINKLAAQSAPLFPAGTGPEVGKTHAKADIWAQPQAFGEAMQNLRTAAAAFDRAARGSDVAAMKAAQGNLGKTCSSCHDRFRAKDD